MPESETGPGVIVVQEWWGLDDGITAMADRLAENGFVAQIDARIQGHVAETDGFFPPEGVLELQGSLDALGKHAVLTVQSGNRTCLHVAP